MLQQTLILLKPDCVQRRLIGRVIARLEDKGLTIIAMKMMHVTPDLARRHYAEHVNKPFYSGLEAFITSAPVVAMVVSGHEVIDIVRRIVGPTSGIEAEAGTIRGDFSCSKQMNLIHASDSAASAEREIGLFFEPQELCNYDPTLHSWFTAGGQ